MRRVLVAALEGKYSDTRRRAIERLFDDSYLVLAPVADAGELAARVRKIDGPESDVWNQTCTLLLIERAWRVQLPRDPIKLLHRTLGFATTKHILRRSLEVADFGGRPPTAPQDIKGALAQLELTLEQIGPVLVQATVSTQSRFLAHLLSSVIRIHPFEDGNGRIARMAVLLCLRLWGLPYVALPKVRNAKAWKVALEQGVEGNIEPLTQEFARRLNASLNSPSHHRMSERT